MEVLNQTMFYHGARDLGDTLYHHMEDFQFDDSGSLDKMLKFLEEYGDVGSDLRIFLDSNQLQEVREKLLLLSHKSLQEYWNQLQQLVESLRVSTLPIVSPMSMLNISMALVST